MSPPDKGGGLGGLFKKLVLKQQARDSQPVPKKEKRQR